MVFKGGSDRIVSGIAMLCFLVINALQAAVPYEFRPDASRLQQEGDVLKNVGKSAISVDCPLPFTPNSRLTFSVRLPQKTSLYLTTGRGREALEIINRGEHFQWSHTSPQGERQNRRPYPVGTSPKPMLYWWENDTYTPRGRTQPSFSLPPRLRDWNAYYQAQQNRKLDEEWWPITVELADGRLRWYFDNILLQDQAATDEIIGRKLQLRFSSGAELRSAHLQVLGEPLNNFYTVNLANRYNAVGEPSINRNSRFVHDNIPFEAATAQARGENCVDLSVSWFREGNLDTGDAPNKGLFGGRWAGALSANPTRVQLRIPNGRYTALYLLATAEARPDRINRVTAQFFRPGSGFPKNFSATAPVPADGKLHLVRIPIAPDALLEMADREVIELELTGDVHVYRASPDPSHYSIHGGGIPPGVKVYAMTLALAPVEVDFQPEAFGNVWVANHRPAYTVNLRNRSSESRSLNLKLRTGNYDGTEKSEQTQQVLLTAGGNTTTRFDLSLQKYGWHQVTLEVDDDLYERSLVILQRRETAGRPFDTPGFMFGIWSPGRLHYSLSSYDVFRLAGPLGIESISHNAWLIDDPDVTALKFGLKNFMVAKMGARSREVDVPDLEEKLRDARIAPSDVNEPTFQYLFAEPGGIGTGGALPEFYGEAPRVRTTDEEARFVDYKRMVTNYVAAFNKVFPGKKILMPWGDPGFAIPFLQDPETRETFDGIGFDTAFFDRLPEMQMHQCSLHSMLQFTHYWKKYRQEPPLLVTVEGPCLGGVKPGALTADQHAAHLPRAMLTLAGYGINRFFASVSGGPENASYWGEQHYGGGAFTRITLNPYPAYATQGTLIRHLRHMVFVRAVPTGSLSTFCYEFKDARNNELLHVLWTIRGQRPVKLQAKQIFDSMDNLVKTPPVIGQLPIYVYGSDGRLELGEPDHSDVQLAAKNIKLGSVAELFTTQTQEADDEYLNSFTKTIRRFPAKMTLAKTDVGLAITLPQQPVDRGTMPFFTTLTPDKPVVIPGKAQYLTVEVTAASDWGRIVYVLRDAKGERWISVGTKDTYSNDDTPNASFFNFDGQRLIRFELPANLPWDDYREMGSTWWGAYDGDKVADLPLSIEKIIIERRPQAIYVNQLEPTDPSPVVLGNLYAEYAKSEWMQAPPPAVEMPPPPVVAKPYNPISELADTATLPTTVIEKVTEPDHYYDGTRGHFHFKEIADAKHYDIYLSLTPDGANAIKLGSALKESGALVRGFLANTEFYTFIVYYNAAGQHSQPSSAFKLKLQDNFANK